MQNTVFVGRAFERSDRRCANGDDASALGFRTVDLFCRFFRNGEEFRVHDMFLDIVDLDWTEGTQSYMQHDGDNLNAFFADTVKQLGGEVKTGGRCCGRAFVLGIYGLITASVLELCCDVRRERHVSDFVKHFIQRAVMGFVVSEADNAVAVLDGFQNIGAQDSLTEGNRRPGLEPSSRMEQYLPDIFLDLLQKQKFNGNRRVFGDLFAVDAGGDDLGFVEYQNVARLQIVDDVAENMMFDLSCFAVEQHQTGFIPIRCGCLRDQMRGKIIVKVLCGQRFIGHGCLLRMVVDWGCHSNMVFHKCGAGFGTCKRIHAVGRIVLLDTDPFCFAACGENGIPVKNAGTDGLKACTTAVFDTVLEMNDRRAVGVGADVFGRINSTGIEPAGVKLRTEHIGRQRLIKVIEHRLAVKQIEIEIVVVVHEQHTALLCFRAVGFDQRTGFLKQRTARKTFLGQPADRQILDADSGNRIEFIEITLDQIVDVSVKREHFHSRFCCHVCKFFGGVTQKSEPFDAEITHVLCLCKRIADLVGG